MKYTEQERLTAVSRFMSPDAGIANDLNDLVNLVAEICETPVALITLLDKDTQWFKAAKGTDLECTDRGLSFCNYTIEQEEVLVIPDMLLDKTFNTNPLVTGEPYVRFYAGAPLITKDGYALGSLCVVDMEPRQFTRHQLNSIKDIGQTGSKFNGTALEPGYTGCTIPQRTGHGGRSPRVGD
jgi:GAF domain-containing protein